MRIKVTLNDCIAVINKNNDELGSTTTKLDAQKMQDPDPLDRKRALQSLCDYVFDPRRVASKEFASVVPILKSLPEDENTEVKLKTAECFGAIAATAAGRLAYEKYDLHSAALKMVVDEDESVRYAAFIAIERVSLSPIGAESLVHAGVIEVLFRRRPEESDMNLVPLLQTLHHCCRLNFEEALKVDGLETLIPLLKRPSPKVRQLAATVIMDLTIERAGREHATKLPVILPLTDLCLDEDDSVKAKSLAALMMICIATKGKYQALENGALEKIIHLVKSDNVEVRLNAIKVLTTLGEAPEGRSELLKYYRMLLRVLNDEYEEVRNAMKILIEVVTFKP